MTRFRQFAQSSPPSLSALFPGVIDCSSAYRLTYLKLLYFILLPHP